MKDEALKLALEALEINNQAWKDLADSGDAGYWEAEEQPFYELSVKAITAIKQALAAPYVATPLVQEPVVFYRCNGCGHAYEQVHPTSCDCMEAGGFDRVKYYTIPPGGRQSEDCLTEAQQDIQRLNALVRAQQITIDKLEAQRQSVRSTWVGLTDEEAQWLYDNCRTPSNLIDMTEAKLKEKNSD